MGAFPILFLGPALLLWLAKFGPIIAIVYTLLWIGYSLTLHPLAKVPGPFWASVTRLWYVYHVYKGDMDKVQRALHEEYGPVIRIAPNEVTSASVADIPRIYRLSDPLLKTDFYPIWGAPQISKQPDQFTCIDENEHTRYRKIVGPIYSLANILKHEKVIGDCTNIFLQRMNEYADKRQAVDIGHWLHMYAFDVVGELCFGRMFGFMENNSDINGWIGALDALMPVMCAAAIAPTYVRPFIMGSAIVFPSIRRALKSFETISNAAVTCVNRRVKEIEAGTADRLDLLQQFSKIVRDKGTKVNFTDSEVTLEGYAAMMAGSDTTAIALRSALYYLMKNPDKHAICRGEIDAHRSTLSSPVRYSEAVAQLPYTIAAIKEAMRLFPSIALSMQRHSPPTGVELSGCFIPPGWRVGCNPCIVHYDQAVFGRDAADYKPERWLESEEKSRKMEKSLLTFGAGTRVCIGKNISLAEVYTLTPEIIRHFDISMAHDRPWKTHDWWFHKQSDIIVDIKRR